MSWLWQVQPGLYTELSQSSGGLRCHRSCCCLSGRQWQLNSSGGEGRGRADSTTPHLPANLPTWPRRQARHFPFSLPTSRTSGATGGGGGDTQQPATFKGPKAHLCRCKCRMEGEGRLPAVDTCSSSWVGGKYVCSGLVKTTEVKKRKRVRQSNKGKRTGILPFSSFLPDS